MHTELKATGASFISGKDDHNPRDLVIESIEQLPDGNRKDVFEHFRAALREMGGEYQRAVDWYFFVNMHDYLTTNRNRQKPPSQQAKAEMRQAALVESIKNQMLDLPMPNGKEMRACTGAEMAKFGNRYQKIAERVGKNKFVGHVLTEDQVRAIMK